MKRTATLIIISLLFLLLSSCSYHPTDREQRVAGESESITALRDSLSLGSDSSDAYLSFENGTSLCFDFSVSTQELERVRDSLDVDITAWISDGTDKLLYSCRERALDTGHTVFTVSVDGILWGDFLTRYVASVDFRFTDSDSEVTELTLSSGEACVYTTALKEYVDRRSAPEGEYTVLTPDGDYSPYTSLAKRLNILSSCLILSLTDTGITDTATLTDGYTSIYSLDYFDGILTVRLTSGALMTEGILKAIYVNGEETYFKVEKGIIRVVLRMET